MYIKPKVLEILKENPSTPYSIIAAKVGVIRERVRQIARKNGYPPRNGILKPKICPICKKPFYTRNLCCSPTCRSRSRRKRVFLNCHHCGKPIERTPGTMRSKRGYYFCTRVCFGKWIGKNHSTWFRNRRPILGHFEDEINSRWEFPMGGGVPSVEVMNIYNELLQLNENELIKVRNSERNKLRKLGIAIKRKARSHGINVTSAIRDVDGDTLLFLMRI